MPQEESALSADDRLFLLRVIEAVNEGLPTGEYSSEQIASKLCMSASTFRRRLLSVAGESPKAYISAIQMERAVMLLTQNPEWRRAQIVVNTITNNARSQSTTIRFLRQLLAEIRIEARINVIVRRDEDSVQEIIHRESAAADIVFMGLAMVEPGQEDSYAARLEELAGQLKAVVFVKNSCMRVGELLTTSEFSST